MRASPFSRIVFIVYLIILMLPVYWLLNMSLRTNEDIMAGLSLFPHHPTLVKYIAVFNDPTWVHAFGVSLSYVVLNTVISVAVALPAAYQRLSLVTNVVATDQSTDVAMLWNAPDGGASGVAYWLLGNAVGQPYYSVQPIPVSRLVQAVDDVTGNTDLKVLETEAINTISGFFVLDLKKHALV